MMETKINNDKNSQCLILLLKQFNISADNSKIIRFLTSTLEKITIDPVNIAKINLTELNKYDDFCQYLTLLNQLSAIKSDTITLEQFIRRLERIQSNSFHKIIIAKIDDVIVGTITVLIEPKFIHNMKDVAHIEDVVVDSRYRGLDIGTMLLLKAITISMGRDYECYKIILDCANSCVNFYKKFGFNPKETQMALYFD